MWCGTRRRGQCCEAPLLLFDPVRWGWCEGRSNSMEGWNRKTQSAQENSKMPLKCGQYLKLTDHIDSSLIRDVVWSLSSLLCYTTQVSHLTDSEKPWHLSTNMNTQVSLQDFILLINVLGLVSLFLKGLLSLEEKNPSKRNLLICLAHSHPCSHQWLSALMCHFYGLKLHKLGSGFPFLTLSTLPEDVYSDVKHCNYVQF